MAETRKIIASAGHGVYRLVASETDDPNTARIAFLRDEQVINEGTCEAYKVWTVLAHIEDTVWDHERGEEVSRG